MNYHIHVNDEYQIIHATVNGVWKLAHSEKLAKELLAISRMNGYTKVLIDHRELLINIPYFIAFRRPSQLKTLFEDIKPRIAFIPPKGRYRLYHFFETVARNRGIDFKIYKDKENAIEWLKNGMLEQEDTHSTS